MLGFSLLLFLLFGNEAFASSVLSNVPDETAFHSVQVPKFEPVVELNNPVKHPDSVVIDSSQREWQQFEGGLPGEHVNAKIRSVDHEDSVNEFYLETKSQFYPVVEYKVDVPLVSEGDKLGADYTDPEKIAAQLAARYKGVDDRDYIKPDPLPEYAGRSWLGSFVNGFYSILFR